MSVGRTIEIGVSRRSSKAEALATAIRAVENLLQAGYSIEDIREHQSAEVIVGYWLSMMPGLEPDDSRDIEQFAQDLVLLLRNAEGNLQLNAITLFLGGIMPTYLKARTLAQMVADGASARNIEAYFHSMAYGSVERFLQKQASGAQAAAREALARLIKVVEDETTELDRRIYQRSAIAFAPPEVGPSSLLQEPAVRPAVPMSQPVAPGTPAPGNAWRGTGLRTLSRGIAERVPQVVVTLLVAEGLQKAHEREMRANEKERRLRSKENKVIAQIVIALQRTETTAEANSTVNECQAQITENRANGERCEEDGYHLMERSLKFKRLADPPKGRGLDGLFEKLRPYNLPTSGQITRDLAPPDRIRFVPDSATPPSLIYDLVGPNKDHVYPRFVVFEAKDHSKSVDESDDALCKAGENRLGSTQTGTQLGVKWTEERIPQTMKRRDSKVPRQDRAEKFDEIRQYRYARWLFMCLRGQESEGKLFVFVDIESSGIAGRIDSKPPKPRPSKGPSESSTPDSTVPF